MDVGGGFGVLHASDAADREAWLTHWRAWPGREVFAHPDYVSLFSQAPDRAACAVWSGPDGGVIFPLILRPIAHEEWARATGTLIDITGPYGYGGPFVWGRVDAGMFWRAFRHWASSAGAVCCFARLSLFGEDLLDPIGSESFNAPNVVRSLDLAPDALWMDYDHKVRKNVKRAQREGVRIEVDAAASRLGDFLSIYHGTMDRRAAGPEYRFGQEFFQKLIRDLAGQFLFFHAIHAGQVVSTELVLVSANHLYSFLGGTRAESFELRPNDLLKHEIILWGHRSGKRAFVLGGGYGGPDGIFKYKLSFAPRGEVPFRTSQMVFERGAYDHLVATRAAWEAGQGHDWQPRPGFFPAYRA